ncbi:general vesicular transport factor p115 isoform X3 [Cloeon dipterum]|uniref:general vesicular transport factor p115 isoform X3 n=1 Tax=Cloeon dipterum TaxID=197152 RepID=UPI00322080EF
MEYFKSGLKSVLGAPQPGQQPSGADTVERLIQRVQTSTLLEDRRDACRALKALSKTYRLEVGAHGMDTLCYELVQDRNDSETIGYTLDALCNVLSPETFEEEEGLKRFLCDLRVFNILFEFIERGTDSVGGQFTEIFIKQSQNVSLVLEMLEEFEFHVRWPAVKLLSSMLAHRAREVQELVLTSPMGVSKLMDLLSDSREVIRNDALLLLISLTKGNANIQKIVAFENAFDRLFEVIASEGGLDGGIVVEDCLLLMYNLLRANPSNQNFFKEGSFIQKLTPMLQPGSEDGWAAQRAANCHALLQVLRTLVAPANPAQATSACQQIMRGSGLLGSLSDSLMASGVPADVLTETVCSVAEVMRGCGENQTFFSQVMAPSNPPRPALVVLLMSMVNEKQPLALRCAVLYCFQCFLHRNQDGQAQLAQTLLPATTEQVSGVTSGTLLCGGLFSPDTLTNWFSCVALSHSLVDNPGTKEQLLRVQLAPAEGHPGVHLLPQCLALLQQAQRPQTRLGLLQLLAQWLAHCSAAVGHLLSTPNAVAHLTAVVCDVSEEELVRGLSAFVLGLCVAFNDDAVVSFGRLALVQLINKRIGTEAFLDRVADTTRHEAYAKAAKHPQPTAATAADLQLDHEFCRLLKALENVVARAVAPKPEEVVEQVGSAQYKVLIRQQDEQLAQLSRQLAQVTAERDHLAAQVNQLAAQVAQLRDQNSVLKAAGDEGGLQARVAELQQQVAKAATDQEDLLELMDDQEAKLTKYRNRLKQLGEKVDQISV